jgi:hypothetical protein
MRIIAREDELVAISDEAALELGSTWAGASFTIQNDTPTLHMYSTSEDAAFKYINSISRAEAASDVEIESASYSLAADSVGHRDSLSVDVVGGGAVE